VLWDPGLAEVKKKKLFSFFSPICFWNSLCEEVFKNGTGRRLVDGAGEERVGSSGSNP
jgi:hypothetical protein